jgi:DNA modification methylase
MRIELRAVDSIKPYPRNPRRNEGAVTAVANSITAYGFRQPIVVDKAGVIVVGHTRWKAAQQLGMTQVPVHVADLTPEQAKAYRLADNKTNEIAEWDEELLAGELTDLKALGVDLDALGWTPDELGEVLAPDENDGLTPADEVPEPTEGVTTKPGDLWILGNHRLLCGDSTNATDLERLMGGQRARMCFTDPPWNVAIGKDSNPRHRQREGLQNDDLTPAQFAGFIDGFAEAIRAAVNGDVYCVLGASEWPSLDRGLRAAGFHWSATVIWVKQVFVLGRAKYHRRYEPIWYGWHEKSKSSFVGGRSEDDVWEIPRPFRSEEHPTMKPVALVERAIKNSSDHGDLIFEPFMGSGTTLIASERLGRACRGMEIEPRYVDVAVRRWQRLTGQKAERFGLGGEALTGINENAPASAGAGEGDGVE